MITLFFGFRLISKDNFKCFSRRTGLPFLSNTFKQFEEKVKLSAMAQYKKEPISGDIKLSLIASFKDKRHSDCSNLGKGAIDALQGSIIINDRQLKHFECIVLENEQKDSFVIKIEIIKEDSNC